jgi:hypothetical protein
MIEQLISRVFYTRNAAHLAHWKTKSYAQHVALGTFYDGLIDTIDQLVEAYQGFFDLISMVPPKPGELLPKDIITYISEEADWIDANRSKIAEDNSALENIIDELSGLYMSTLYKLRNLS